MEDRDIRLPGVAVRTQVNGVVTTINRLAYQDVLDVRSNVTNGDGHTLYPHEYVVLRRSGLRGIDRISTLPVAYNNTTEEGYLADASAYPNVSPPIESTRVYNDCVSDLNDQFRGSLDHSVNVFQLSQMNRMFRDITKVISIFRSLRKTPIRALGGKVLEYRYGWQPLLQDIYDTFDQMAQFGLDDPIRYSARSKFTETHEARSPSSGYSQVYKVTHRGELVVWLLPPSSATQWLARYTSLNPASIAWELLPYSFVVDWFYNIGNYMRDLETALIYNSRFVRGYFTYTRRFEGTVTAFVNRDATPARAGEFLHASANYIQQYKKRSVLGSYPLPHLPVLNTHLGSGRLLNAAALLSQFLRH